MIRFLFILLITSSLFGVKTWANETSPKTPKALSPITLQLLWKHQFEFAGFYAAKSKGFYQAVGLDVSFRELNYNENTADEVISGRAQFGINDSTLLVERDRGKPVVLLSNIFQHSPIVLITKSESGITSPAHMIGKTIMLGSNELNNASIKAMLSKESVSLNDMNIVDLSFNINDLVNNKVDIMSSYVTNQPGVLKKLNIPINIVSPINYGIDFYGNNIFTSEQELNNHPQRVSDFVNASIKGWQYALNNPKEIIDLILQQYSQKKSRAALEFEAETLPQFIVSEFTPLGTIDDKRLLSNITTYQELGLLDSTFTLEGFLARDYKPYESNHSLFTPDEIAWIKEKKQLTIGVDPNWRPFEFINDQKQFSGMSADFIALIAQKTGLSIKVQNNKTWSDVINSAKNKTLDLLPAVMRSPQRDKYLDFAPPHIKYPMVIVTSKNSSFISQLDDLKGEKVVVIKDYATEDLLHNNHPKLQLVTAINIDEALSIVSSGDATAFVDNLATITTSITKGGFNNLRISGTTQYSFDVGLAVPKGNTTLLNIMQKALDDITPDERSAIKNKWISLQYTQSVDYSAVYLILLISATVLLFVIIWNRRLTREIYFRKIAEKKALDSEQNFRMLFEDNKAIELIIDPNEGVIVEANRAAIEFYGYPREELNGKKLNLINILSEDEIKQEIELAKKEKRNHYYFQHRIANGEIRDVETHSGPVQWKNKTLLYSIIHDVTTEKKLQSELAIKATELEFQATHDALTGLINRREFEHRLAKAIDSCIENKVCKRTVLALDLDNFKVVNDTAGHAVGDEVLYKISQLMSSKVRGRDTFARLGGDEFGVLLDNCPIADAEEVASTIIEAVKNFHYQWHDSTFYLGVSIGIAAIECNNASMDDTLNQADAACYEAKRLGRNRSQIFSEANVELSRRKGERWWTNEIVSAMDENRFCLFYQTILPISETNKKEGEQFEVLIRLLDAEGNLIFPDSFIPAAERYHLMPSIDLWVIENTFLHIAANPIERSNLHKCSINLSGQSFASEGFYEKVMDKFKTHRIPPHIICWEITETAAIADFNKAKEFITKMRQFGCSFSLDDFGSGLSSFNYLKHLEVDFIKIDGSFIKEILTEPKDQLIVESIQNISKGLGMQTIAEFVGNNEIKHKLIDIGVDYVQGYGIHKPSPLK